MLKKITQDAILIILFTILLTPVFYGYRWLIQPIEAYPNAYVFCVFIGGFACAYLLYRSINWFMQKAMNVFLASEEP